MLRYNAVIIFKLVLRVPLSLSLWINCSWFIFGYWILYSALFRNPIVTLQAKLGFPCYLYKIYPSKAAGYQQSCWSQVMLLKSSNAALPILLETILSLVLFFGNIDASCVGVNLCWWTVCYVGDRYLTMSVHRIHFIMLSVHLGEYWRRCFHIFFSWPCLELV